MSGSRDFASRNFASGDGPSTALYSNVFDDFGRRQRIERNANAESITTFTDGMVVSWSIGTRPDAELVNTMLDAAIQTVTISREQPVVHSDRGGHYRWPGWLSRIAEAQLARSTRHG